MSEPIYPFSNGTEFYVWLAANCDRCPLDTRCEVQNALGTAFWGDGTVSRETADRLGYSHEASAEIGWPCKERTSLTTPPASPALAAEGEA